MASFTLSVAGLLVAILAAFVSYRAYRVTHDDAISDRLFNSLGDLLAALSKIDLAVGELANSGGDETGAWASVVPYFAMFKEAVIRVDLARTRDARSPDEDEVGTWILDVSNNLAVSLLQADESKAIWRERGTELLDEDSNSVALKQWNLLARSSSFWTVRGVLKDLPQPTVGDPRFLRLDQWWGEKICRFGSTTSVYHPDMDWLTQHTRLLSDFGRDYITPWAKDLVTLPSHPHRRNTSWPTRVKQFLSATPGRGASSLADVG